MMKYTIEGGEIYISIDELIDELEIVVLQSRDEAFSEALESVLRVLHNDRVKIAERVARKRWWRFW